MTQGILHYGAEAVVHTRYRMSGAIGGSNRGDPTGDNGQGFTFPLVLKLLFGERGWWRPPKPGDSLPWCRRLRDGAPIL